MKRPIHSVGTAMGPFVFSLECEGSSDTTTIEIHEVTPAPALLELAVERCTAIVACVRSRAAIPTLRWSCVSPPLINGSPCTGEWLDAQEWHWDGRLVIVGTEDSEMLKSRFPFLTIPQWENLTYLPNRLELRLDNIPADTSLSLHYVLAENPLPEPAEAAAWCAVDIQHHRLLDLIRL